MLSPASPARVRRSRRGRSQRSTSTTWECTVPARSAGRAPGRRRCRAIQPVTAVNTDADTSRLARSGTAGSRGRGDWLWRDDLRSESPRPLPEPQLSPATTPLSPSVLVRKPHYIVDSSRNGKGSDSLEKEWCNSSGLGVGRRPGTLVADHPLL